MNNKPLVSVIIPVYNGEQYLASTLESIMQQSYQNYQVVAVDDGSTDASADILRSWKKIRYYYQSNQGVAAARNKGLTEAKGEFIAFIDQDDLWTPDKLTVQVDYLLAHPQVGYTLAQQRLLLESGMPPPSWLKQELLDKDHTGYILGTLVARKSVFEEIGSFNTNYVTASDSDWFFRAKDAGIPMKTLPNVLLHKRIHNKNQSAEVRLVQSELLKVVRASVRQKRHQKLDTQ